MIFIKAFRRRRLKTRARKQKGNCRRNGKQIVSASRCWTLREKIRVRSLFCAFWTSVDAQKLKIRAVRNGTRFRREVIHCEDMFVNVLQLFALPWAQLEGVVSFKLHDLQVNRLQQHLKFVSKPSYLTGISNQANTVSIQFIPLWINKIHMEPVKK